MGNMGMMNNASVVPPELAGNEAVKGYAAAMGKMMASEEPYTGNADVDFARRMIPHHQAAIDMAQVVLRNGKDPGIRALAEEVIKAQQREIDTLRDWLARNGA